MSDISLALLQSAGEAATAAPWAAPETLLGLPCTTVFAGEDQTHVLYHAGKYADAAFVATARNSWQRLLDRIAHAEDARAYVAKTLDNVNGLDITWTNDEVVEVLLDVINALEGRDVS